MGRQASELAGAWCVPMYQTLALAYVETQNILADEFASLSDNQKAGMLAAMFQAVDGLEESVKGSMRVSEMLEDVAKHLSDE